MKSAKMGDCVSYRNIEWLYLYGNVCTENYVKAKYFFEKTIEIDPDDDYSLYYMGMIYEYGCGVKMDISKARDYYKRATELGNEEAQSDIAKIEMKLKIVHGF